MSQEKIGIVVSDKMEKTIVVVVEDRYRHPQYSKILIKTKRYMAHDENNEAKIGDKVILDQSRPISRKKRWILKEIIS
jgi:small subunit ribosomal protein S17